jgi:hypothetical protein
MSGSDTETAAVTELFQEGGGFDCQAGSSSLATVTAMVNLNGSECITLSMFTAMDTVTSNSRFIEYLINKYIYWNCNRATLTLNV